MPLRLGPLFSLLAITPFLAELAPAQVPPNHAVIGSTAEPGWPGTAGLWVVPLAGGPTTPITGLPPELSVSSAVGYAQGANGLSFRSSDGALLVTTFTDAFGPTQGDIQLWVLHLNGLVVDTALTQTIVLGRATGYGMAGHEQLPDGRVLVHAVDMDITSFAPSTLQAGPMANTRWAIVDPNVSPPTVTALPTPPGITGQEFVSFDVDPTGRYAYYVTTTQAHPAVGDSTLFRFDLQAGTECQIASWPGETAWGVACDDDGIVYVSSTNRPSVQHFVHTVVPDGCNPAAVTSVQSSQPILAWGLELDRASGRFLSGSLYNRPGFSGTSLNRLSAIDKVTGQVEVLSTIPTGGYSTMAPDLAVNNAMDSYGAPTDGQNRHWFENFPNPTGYPFVGNTSFSLHMASAPGAATLSALSLSFGRGSTNVLGAEYLLNPAAAVTTIVPSGLSVPYALPLPNVTGLAGLTLVAQSLHLDANNTLTTSRGLELVVQLLPAPTINRVTPSAPPPSTTVTVTGRHFFSGMQLTVAGNPTPIASQTPTSITFVMPSGVPCGSSLSLTNLGNSVGTATVNGAPVISTMSSGGPAAGNQLFFITGENLDAATVTFNGTPPLSVISQSQTNIIGYTPAGTLGPATVLILGQTGCSVTGTYTYVP